MSERYAVFRVFYDTYENIARDGHKAPERVSGSMPYAVAMERLPDYLPAENYRFCIKPWPTLQ
jgi:hypothetical protein